MPFLFVLIVKKSPQYFDFWTPSNLPSPCTPFKFFQPGIFFTRIWSLLKEPSHANVNMIFKMLPSLSWLGQLWADSNSIQTKSSRRLSPPFLKVKRSPSPRSFWSASCSCLLFDSTNILGIFSSRSRVQAVSAFHSGGLFLGDRRDWKSRTVPLCGTLIDENSIKYLRYLLDASQTEK